MNTVESKEVAFMGRVTAGFTHEMKNVLAIIKESAGLMEDLLSLTPEGAFPQRERLFRVLSKILEQVQRGVILSTKLNRFAHSPDEPVAVVDLNEMMEQAAVLAERFARLKGVTLKVEPASERLPVRTSPVSLLMAVFLGMECCWDRMEPGSEMRIAGSATGDEVKVSLSAPGDCGASAGLASAVAASEKWEGFVGCLTRVEGRAEWCGDGSGLGLFLPRNLPRDPATPDDVS